MKVKFYYIVLIICLSNNVYAQTQIKSDSTISNKRWEIGAGVCMGINRLYSKNPNFIYQSENGFDYGFLLNANIYLGKRWGFIIDGRISNKGSLLTLANNVFYNSFYLKMNGFQLMPMISYRVLGKNKKEIVKIATGVSYNRFNLITTNDNFYTGVKGRFVSGGQYLNNNRLNYFSGVFSLSKVVSIHRTIGLTMFSELEYKPNILEVQYTVGTDYDYTTMRYNVTNDNITVRLGIYISYQKISGAGI